MSTTNNSIEDENSPVGCHNLVHLADDRAFNFFIFIGSIIAYFCVAIDFVIAISKDEYYETMQPLSTGSLVDLIFCYDFLFLVHIILVINKRPTTTRNRHTILCAIDILSFIPFELIYITVNGTDIRIYYGMRLRYTLRLIRLVSQNTRNYKFRLVPIVINYIVATSIACMTLTCFHLLMICHMDKRNKAIDCSNMGLRDFSIVYLTINEKNTVCEILLHVELGGFHYLPMFQFILLMVLIQRTSKIICTCIEILTLKYEFAILSHLVLQETKGLTHKVNKWSIKNNIFEKFLRKYLKTSWHHWMSKTTQKNFHGYAVASIPDIVKTEIILDVSWNMFKHSVLFRNEDVHFLRHISLLTSYQVLMEGQPVYNKGQFKSQMLYIVSGVVHVLSEDNLDVPIVSFSSGTVLGEMSLFLALPATTTLLCKTYCEIIVLPRTNFLKCRTFYPTVYERMKTATMQRLNKARNYHTIGKLYYEQGYVGVKKDVVSLRYIKKILRKYISMPSRESKIHEMLTLENLKEDYEMSKAILCPEYLTMYVVADELDTGTTEHFLTTGFFFVLNPNSPLVTIWNFILYVMIMITCIAYPIGATTISESNSGIYDTYMTLVSILWVLDFSSFAFIGMETKETIHRDIEYIFNKRIQTVEFWIDFISTIPIDYIFSLLQGPIETKLYRLLQMNRLLKAYKLIRFIDKKQYSSSRTLLIVAVTKFLMTGFFIVLFAYYVFHVNDYLSLVTHQDFDRSDFFQTFLFVASFFIGSSQFELEVTNVPHFLPIIVLQYIGFIWKLLILPQLAAAYTLHYTTAIEFENLVDDIRKVFVLDNFDVGTRRKILKYLYMHYQCGKGLHMLKYKSLKDFIGTSLFKTQRTMVYYDLFENVELFQGLTYNFIRDMNEISKLIFIPKGEFVVYAGALPKEIYLIVEGTCAYVTEQGGSVKIIKHVGVGECLLVIEVLSRVKIVHNVITLTDCKLLCLPYSHLNQKFVKYQSDYDMLQNVLHETVNPSALSYLENKEMGSFEIIAKDEHKSFKRFKKNTNEYLRGFGKKRFFRFFLLLSTIRPYGPFWVHWEIFNIIISYLSAFLGTIPLIVCKGVTSPFFWMFRLFDAVAFIDIYLRHHVFFYNMYNIEVSHPWHTAKNYWKSSFGIDLLTLLPLELFSIHPIKENRIVFIVLSRINKYIRLYRVFGLKKFLNQTYLSEVRSYLLAYYILTILLVFNLITYLGILMRCTCHEKTNEIECPFFGRKKFWYVHFLLTKRMFKNLFNLGLFSSRVYKAETLTWYALINVIGYVMLTLITCRITALGMSRNSYLTTFQIKMQRLIGFMNMRKIDKNLRNEIIKYYEYLWLLREGKTLQETFDSFNVACYEEVVFSLMGKSVQSSVIFKYFPKVIMKDFLSDQDTNRDVFLIKGVIIRVNDVQNRLYILCKGTIDVLGPDLSKLTTLEVGSVFGCLDNVQYHRSTLTYVAKTHCECISIKTMTFYNIVRKYTSFYHHFLFLVKSSNIDYILSPQKLSKGKRNKTGPQQEFHETKFRKERKKGKIVTCILQVHKPNEKFTIAMVIFCCFSFIIESFQKIVLDCSPVMIAICYIMDILFLLRIYGNFSQAYENMYGLWVEKRKLIALRYIKDYFGFIFDLSCTFPFEVMSLIVYNDPNWTMFWSFMRLNRLLKIIIVFRFVKSFRNRLNVNVYLIRISYILLLVMTLQQLSMILIVTCHWSTRTERFWETYINTFGIQTYFLTTALGKAVESNYTSQEVLNLLYTILLFTSRFVMMYVVAEYVACYQVLNYSKFRYGAYLKSLENEMSGKRVSLPLFTRVMKYFTKLADGGRNVQFPVFVRDAPYYLREGVLDSMFGFHLRRHPIFKECHVDLTRQIAATFETIFFFPGDFIAFYGDMDSKMYFIHEGEVDCLIEDNLYFETVERTYKTGDSFGFKQLFYNYVGHKYSYKVVSECTVLVLKREAVMHLLEFFPASKHVIYNFNKFAKKNVNLADALK